MLACDVPATRHPEAGKCAPLLVAAFVAVLFSPAASLVPSYSVVFRARNAHALVPARALRHRTLSRASALRMSGQSEDSGLGGGPPDFVDLFGNSLGPQSPEAVSSFKLRILLLHMRLKVALREERYEHASRLQKQLDELRSKDTDILVTKLHNVSKVMKADLEKQRSEHEAMRIQHELDMAVAEQNFTHASVLREVLKSTVSLADKQPAFAASNIVNSSKHALLNRIDIAWLESELATRVALMKAKHEASMQDPVARLEYQLRVALDGEDFEMASEVHERLRHHQDRQDEHAMWRELRRALGDYKARIKRLSKDPEKNLRHHLGNAINAEDYEEAACLWSQICEAEIARMHQTLEQKVKDAKHRKDMTQRQVAQLSVGEPSAQSVSETDTAATSYHNHLPNKLSVNALDAHSRVQAEMRQLTVEERRTLNLVIGSFGVLSLAGFTWFAAVASALSVSLGF